MYKYVITLKCITIQAGLEFIYYPIITRETRTSDKKIVEKAVENRYAREHRGLAFCKAVRTSAERVRRVA